MSKTTVRLVQKFMNNVDKIKELNQKRAFKGQ